MYQRFFRSKCRGGRIARDFLTPYRGVRDEIFTRQDRVEQPDPERFFRVDDASAQTEFRSDGAADQSRQSLRAIGAGNDADTDFGLAQMRPF